MSNQEIVTQQENSGFMQVNTLEEAMRCSKLIAESSFCPKSMINKPGDVLVALQMGQELGLKPMQALQNIAVINGRPSLWGDAMLAVCRQSKDFEFITEVYDAANDSFTCTVKRRNEPEVVRSFSMAEAKTAGLTGKEGPWRTYPKRMLQMRARGFALRDAFPDTLRGILIKEEAQDMPTERVNYSSYSSGITIDNRLIFIGAVELSILKSKIESSESKEIDICQHLKIGCIEEMTINQWNEICRMLDKKISKKRKSDELEINKIFETSETKLDEDGIISIDDLG